MKYFFSNNCYWDSEMLQVFRNDIPVDLPSSHTKILTRLLKNNGHFVSHEELYHALTGLDPFKGDTSWKTNLSNKFTRNKPNDKGLLVRVPEIEPFFEKSKSQIGGGYKISVPEESIIDTTHISANSWDEYRDIWHSMKYWENQQKKARVSDQDWLSKKAKLYLQGEQCSWPLIFASSQYAPVKRDVVNELIDAIENEIGAIVLTGAGGEGKTTVLMQLCAELYSAGKNVLYHAPTHKYDIPDNVIDGIFLVDNPANTSDFKNFLTKATKEGLTVVIASRSNEWAALKETLFDDTRRSVKEIELPKISVSESKAFAQYIKTHIHWIKRSVVELEKLFFKDSYGFLYASMLMAIYNADSLEKIAAEIIERISKFENGETTLRVLAAFVFAEQAGTAIGTRTYRSLCKHFSVDDRDVKYYLRKEVVLNGTVYQTRHESISQLFYKYLFKDGDWWSYLNEEEREDVIIAVLDVYLGEVEKASKDYRPTDPRAIEISGLFVQAFKVVDYEETQDFIIQRLFESCQQHGLAVIDRLYHHTKNDLIKNIVAQGCYERKLPVWEVYRHWINSLMLDLDNISHVLELLSHICLDMEASVHLWLLWADIQEKAFNLQCGNYKESVQNIYVAGMEKFADTPHLWMNWAAFEIRTGNMGDPLLPHSARWILREGCMRIPMDQHLWIKLAETEEAVGNVGSYDQPYSSAWLYKTTCEKHGKVGECWIKWSRFIDRHGGTDELGNTAELLLQKVCVQNNGGTDAWSEWSTKAIEAQNFGDYQTFGTAAWILKEACTNHNPRNDPVLWQKWAAFAKEHVNISNEGDSLIEVTAAEVLKRACLQYHIADSQTWAKWAKEETEQGNIGNYDIVGSAAWIYKEACKKYYDDDHTIWMWWESFIRTYSFPISADTCFEIRQVFKNACVDIDTIPECWAVWAAFEECVGNVGDYSLQGSAAWILSEGCKYHNPNNHANIIFSWAQFAYSHEMTDRTGLLVTAKTIIDYGMAECPGFRNEQWNELTEFKNKIGWFEN